MNPATRKSGPSPTRTSNRRWLLAPIKGRRPALQKAFLKLCHLGATRGDASGLGKALGLAHREHLRTRCYTFRSPFSNPRRSIFSVDVTTCRSSRAATPAQCLQDLGDRFKTDEGPYSRWSMPASGGPHPANHRDAHVLVLRPTHRATPFVVEQVPVLTPEGQCAGSDRTVEICPVNLCCSAARIDDIDQDTGRASRLPFTTPIL